MPLLPIKTAAQRKANVSLSILLAGGAGVGKTTQAKILHKAGYKVLVIDGEAGMLSVDDAKLDSIPVREFAQEAGVTPWQLCRNIAVVLAGSNPAKTGDADIYGKAHYKAACAMLGGANVFDQYDVIFFDSISEFSRDSFTWSCQPDECQTRHRNLEDRKNVG